MAESYLARRWQNTRQHTWPGFTWHIAAVQVIGLAGAIGSSYLLAGSDFALAELKSWGMFTLAWIGAANLAFLLINWRLAPSRMDKEKSDHITDLEAVLQLDRRRIAIKERIGNALIDGKKFMKECRSEGVERVDLESRTNAWFSDLQQYVKSAFGEGDVAYLQAGFDTSVYTDPNQPNEDLRKSLDHILQRLTKILQGADIKPIRDDFVIEKKDE